ncbi:MAG: hypothetical protein H7329_11730 [Opitutaceae bacterium]|nr:hypothetical protein [Cytophagales bacterium]
MKESERTYNLIERYLNGEMDPAEQKSFLLSLTPELKSKIKTHQLTNVLVKENRLLNVKSLAQQSHKNEPQTSKYIKAGIITATITIAVFSIWLLTNEVSEKQVQPNPTTTIIKSEIGIRKDSFVNLDKNSPDKDILLKEDYPKNSANQNQTPATELKSVIVLDSIENKNENLDISIANYKEKEETSIKSPCEKVKLKAKIYATPTCIGEHTGSIIVSGFSGGTAPYKSMLKHQNHIVSTDFSELAQGNYQLLISDLNNCESVIDEIKVESKTCYKNYHFNPFIGEKWEIPSAKINGELSIKDNAGNTYYSANIQADSQEYWTGMSATGELKPGYYLYLIQYVDGSVNQGTVTIVQ